MVKRQQDRLEGINAIARLSLQLVAAPAEPGGAEDCAVGGDQTCPTGPPTVQHGQAPTTHAAMAVQRFEDGGSSNLAAGRT